MVDRLIVGHHPVLNEYGIWLSKPGEDVKTATDFLLSSSQQQSQVLMSGIIDLANGASGTVMFPETLESAPVVSFISSTSAVYIVLPVDMDSFRVNSASVNATPYTDRVVFQNQTQRQAYIHYSIILGTIEP